VVEYANESREAVATYVDLYIGIRDYRKRVSFYVAEIDEEAILGGPFFESIHIRDLLWKEGRLGFYDLQTGRYHNWVSEEKSGEEEKLSVPESRRIARISLTKFLSRHRKLRSVYSVRVNRQPEKGEVPNDQEKNDPIVTRLLQRFQGRFQDPTGLPPERPEDLVFETTTDQVPKQRGIGILNEEELKQLRKQLKEMMDRGHIQPSTSPYGSSILFARKHDGSLRMCVDYRGLNNITVKNKCPVPNISELRERLAVAKYLTKLDLRDGFYNLRVKKEDAYKTAFKCRYGHFEFRVVPMGLSNSVPAFQAMMNRIFKPFIDMCVIVYIDDLLVNSKSKEDHERDLNKVFSLIEKHQFFVKRSKCDFMKTEVEFCGHRVTGEGISISEQNKKEMSLKPVIRNVADLR
jgi:hypothetical protein